MTFDEKVMKLHYLLLWIRGNRIIVGGKDIEYGHCSVWRQRQLLLRMGFCGTS